MTLCRQEYLIVDFMTNDRSVLLREDIGNWLRFLSDFASTERVYLTALIDRLPS